MYEWYKNLMSDCKLRLFFCTECVTFPRYVVYTKIDHDQQFPCLPNRNCNIVTARI